MGLNKPKQDPARVAVMDQGGEAQSERDSTWQRPTREETQALLQKQKEYRKLLHERYLPKAAADAEKEFEARKSPDIGKCSGESGCADPSCIPPRGLS